MDITTKYTVCDECGRKIELEHAEWEGEYEEVTNWICEKCYRRKNLRDDEKNNTEKYQTR